jgi:predicted SprT family Zn-dependent metalloprotease
MKEEYKIKNELYKIFIKVKMHFKLPYCKIIFSNREKTPHGEFISKIRIVKKNGKKRVYKRAYIVLYRNGWDEDILVHEMAHFLLWARGKRWKGHGDEFYDAEEEITWFLIKSKKEKN